jgi:Serine dehydrogenase proteinase
MHETNANSESNQHDEGQDATPEQAPNFLRDDPKAATAAKDVPQQPPPPPNILLVISRLAKDNLNAAYQRIAEDIQGFIDTSDIASKYDFLFLYDEQSSISERTSNKLYAAASSEFRDKSKPAFLLLHTRGGAPVPAYLISRYLKTSSEHGFVVSVPRRAKSAGTLIALGAKEIHMGMMSELGPVDPQFSNLPALGLGSALDYIARICEKYPASSEMLAKYLHSSLSIQHLGYFERVSESATHYAEKLLKRDELPSDKAEKIAKHLVYGYKDHSFAIDCDEIQGILGTDMVKIETPEYRLANQIHEYMELVNLGYSVFHDKYCTVTGRADGLSLQDSKDE